MWVMLPLKILPGLWAVFMLLSGACTYKTDVSLDFPTPPPASRAEPAPPVALRRDAELERQFASIAAGPKGPVRQKVGAAAVLLGTGDFASLNADSRFPMQSVYKLPIAMAVMEQVRLGNLDLDERIGVTKDDMVRQGMRSPLRDKNPDGGEFTIRELIRLSLVESDGTSSDVLVRVAGGAPEIQSYMTQIGIKDMKVVNTEKEIGRDWETQYQNWATPEAAVELLRWLDLSAEGWQPPNVDENIEGSKLIVQFMWQSIPGQKRLMGLLPLKAPWGAVVHKTGTGGTREGITSATNDIGIIYLPNGRRVAIAVFVSDSPADEKTREAVIAKMAKAVWDRWAK